MAFRFDGYDSSLVIDGFENGIADNPYAGLANIRNANLISVPGEASVGFGVTSITPVTGSDSVISANAGSNTVKLNNAGLLDLGQAIVFSGGSLPSGIVAGTTYYLKNVSSNDYHLYSDPGLVNIVTISGTGTGTWSTINMGEPMYFTEYLGVANQAFNFMVDSLGQVWSNVPAGITAWRFMGNTTDSTSHGNGIVAYVPSNYGTASIAYVFVFRDFQIDYLTVTSNTGFAWTYGWNPATSTSGNSNYLKAYNTNSSAAPHEAMVAPDSRVYYCDSNWVGRFYQTDPSVAFDPTSLATYTADNTALLPTTDRAQCLAFLGTNLLVGGKNNVIYPWDRFDTNFNYPILVAESNIQKMVTINTNTYALVGNRGRIYITNGSQAQLFKKIPDHISGTVEPYFTWGGLTTIKNQIYFGVSATTNGGTAIPQYGGLWAIDADTKALRLVNELSFNTYAGLASAILPNFNSNPAGTGLYIGWADGNGGFGMDATSSTPYTGSQTTIDSDLIPIGTYNKPRDLTYVEYRLSRPLVSGESVVIKTRLIFNTSDTGFTTTLTDSTVGNYSFTSPINFINAQWVQFQVILNSTASSPSYVRLREIRVSGLTGPTAANAPQLSV